MKQALDDFLPDSPSPSLRMAIMSDDEALAFTYVSDREGRCAVEACDLHISIAVLLVVAA